MQVKIWKSMWSILALIYTALFFTSLPFSRRQLFSFECLMAYEAKKLFRKKNLGIELLFKYFTKQLSYSSMIINLLSIFNLLLRQKWIFFFQNGGFTLK